MVFDAKNPKENSIKVGEYNGKINAQSTLVEIEDYSKANNSGSLTKDKKEKGLTLRVGKRQEMK